MNNLISHWIAMSTACGEPLEHVLRELNTELHSNYTISRLGEWRDGRRAVPEPVQRYMLQLALAHILRRHGVELQSLEDDYIDPIVDALMPPNRT